MKAAVKNLFTGRKVKMPGYFKPMMAKVTKNPFDKNGWIYEIKWDGYRVISFIEKNKVELMSRNLKNFNTRFPDLIPELKKIKLDAILDGEVVALNTDGKPNFQALQDNIMSEDVNLRYFVFDLIYYDGYELSNLPLIKRKEILSHVLPKSHLIKFCDHVEDEGIKFFSAVKKLGLEGAMAKDGQGKYLKNTRSSLWLKIKNFKSRDAVIIGYTKPLGGRSHFGSLVLAAYKSSQLYYIGHVGTGFNDKMLESLYKKFQNLIISEAPLKQVPKTNGSTIWLRPTLVCEIKFNEMTKENIIRQPSFIRLRDDINPSEVKL